MARKTRTLVLVDDASTQKSQLRQVKHKLKEDHIDLHTLYVDPNDDDFCDEDGKASLKHLLREVEKKVKGRSCDLVAVDYDLGGEVDFTGIEVIKHLRGVSRFKKVPVFLISGRREKVIAEVLESDGHRDKIAILDKLFDYNIVRFLDKEFHSEATHFLRSSNIEGLLTMKLRQQHDHDGAARLHVLSPRYSNMTLAELAEQIEENQAAALDILSEMFDLTLTHYANINEAL